MYIMCSATCCERDFWGTKKGSQYYRLKYHILEKKNEYVRHMMKDNVARESRIVYMYESYIHNNYCRHEDSLYDPNEEQDLTQIAHHKDKCYYLIAAIVDTYHSVPYIKRTDAQKTGLLHDTLEIF